MTRTNPWLAQHITNNRREAKPEPCPRCGQPTLIGPDHHRVASPARVNVTPCDALTEVAALLAGRRSYDLIGKELDHRDQWRQHGKRRYPVLLEHTCPTDGAA